MRSVGRWRWSERQTAWEYVFCKINEIFQQDRPMHSESQMALMLPSSTREPSLLAQSSFIMIPWNRPAPFLKLNSPHSIIPLFDKPNLDFVNITPLLANVFLCISVVQLKDISDELYICKSCHFNSGLLQLQQELDNYVKLRHSPYILPLRGLVRCDDWSIEFSDSGVPNPVQRGALCGLLIPFCGSHSTLWFPREGKPFEKEVLAVALLDAVLDVELRGVNLCDLKRANILLTPRGLRLIDIDACAKTSSNIDDPAQQTVYNFGMTLSELFSETLPLDNLIHDTSLLEGATPLMANLIERCCFSCQDLSMKQLYDNTLKMLRPIRSRTRVTVSSLAELRYSRIRLQTQLFNEAWLGLTSHNKAWYPTFDNQKICHLIFSRMIIASECAPQSSKSKLLRFRFLRKSTKCCQLDQCQVIWCSNFGQPLMRINVVDCHHLSFRSSAEGLYKCRSSASNRPTIS